MSRERCASLGINRSLVAVRSLLSLAAKARTCCNELPTKTVSSQQKGKRESEKKSNVGYARGSRTGENRKGGGGRKGYWGCGSAQLECKLYENYESNVTYGLALYYTTAERS